tara:strand:+ start:51 stop:431 length:381 start_codon:yes stop_codon:yes gene_type:complete
MAYSMKGFSGFKSPAKFKKGNKQKPISTKKYGEKSKYFREVIRKLRVQKEVLTGMGMIPGKSNLSKGFLKAGGKVLSKFLGPIGVAASAYEAGNFIKNASKEVDAGLKNRAKNELRGGSMYTSSKL